MCGIAGIISKNNSLTEKVDLMVPPLLKRGPDNQAAINYGNGVALAHTRLSIIDLEERSNQPFTDEDSGYTIVFNGEIYNYRGLRKDLTNNGCKFSTTSDTEVILNGYKKEGQSFFKKMEGMWALAIWDKAENKIILSRDRYGEKPLYYYKVGNTLIFASNLASVNAVTPNLTINKNAIADLIAMQYIHTEICIYNEVDKLAPASVLVFNIETGNISKSTYWKPIYNETEDRPEEEWLKLIEEYLIDAIQKQITSSDVPVGLFLSGGVDSGLIAGIAATINPNIEAISMSVAQSERNEIDLAKNIAKRHGIKLHEVAMNEDCIGELPFLLKDIEPLADSSLLPLSFVAGQARLRMKVALTGDGGDELFGGYGIPLRFLEKGRPYTGFKKTVSELALKNRYKGKFWRMLRRYAFSQQAYNLKGLDLFFEQQDSATKSILNSVLKNLNTAYSIPEIYRKYVEDHKDVLRDDCSAVLLAGIKGRLAGDFLHKVDTGTMRHSLESRSPFLHHPILDLVAKIPSHQLLNKSSDKYLLKKVAIKYNPKEIVYAQKKGFSIPTEEYFTKGWKTILTNLIDEGISADLGLIEPKGVKSLLSDHSKTRPFRLSNQLYALLVIELWLRVFHLKTHSPELLRDYLLNNYR
jgi:asparagine synthase (glutamine-hydrolysing)